MQFRTFRADLAHILESNMNYETHLKRAAKLGFKPLSFSHFITLVIKATSNGQAN